MITRIQNYFEKQAFGVCEWWGKKLGIKTQNIRLFFIYLSFITFGSAIFIYMAMAFVLDHRSMFRFRRKRRSVWDL